MLWLTMFAQVLHHPPQHHRHTFFQQALLLQLKQGCAKHLGVLGCLGSQYGHLDHLLHVLFNLHCSPVVLDIREQILAVSRCNRHQVRDLRDSCSAGGRLCAVWRWHLWRVYTCIPREFTLSCIMCWELRGLAVQWVATTNIRLPCNTLG